MTKRTRTIDDNKRKIALVTHLNPDLDAVAAIWLLTRFVYPKDEYSLQFVPIHSDLANGISAKFEEVIYVDTGGGKYDHHGTAAYTCAAHLVMNEFSLGEDAAISRMIEYVLAVDHGKTSEFTLGDFDLLRVIEGLNVLFADQPREVVDALLPCFDAIYESLDRLIIAEKDLERAIIFDTKWGKGAAIETPNQQTRNLAHRLGYKVFIFADPTTGYKGFTAPGTSDVNYSEIFRKVRTLEPDADWFLHSSTQLLLCGSQKAPDRKLSHMSLPEMIDLIRS